MIPVRIVSNAPLEIAGRVGETADPKQNPVLIKIDGVYHMVDQRYVRRVPWPIRLAVGGKTDDTE